jgi:hypothetical protein
LAAQSELNKAIEEFKIQTREMGMRTDGPARKEAGAAAKPTWHGRVYENLRNDFLDAVPHQIKQRGGDKSLLRRNQFGFNLAGPLAIPWLYPRGNKTFFSVSYEGVRSGVARSYLQTIPTVPERTGDFSALVNQAGEYLVVYDPATTARNPNFNNALPVSEDNLEYMRAPFPGNRISASRWDAVAARAQAYYPPPNASVGPFFRNNFFQVSPETNNADGVIANVDHTVRTRHRLTLNIKSTDGFTGAADTLPTAANPGAADRAYSDRTITLGHTFAKSARIVNTFRVTAEAEVSASGGQTDEDYAGQLGLRGSSPAAFPAFSISPYTSLGRSYPRSRSNWAYYFLSDSFSVRHGRHSVALSGRHNRYQITSYQEAYPSGYMRFGSGLTGLPGVTGTGHGFASFLLGVAEYAEKSFVVSPSYFRYATSSFSAREQYQANKGLTLTLTLELLHDGARREKYDRQSTVDLSVVNPANGRMGAMVVAGENGVGHTLQRPHAWAEPSFGLAWNIGGDANAVLRVSVWRDQEAPGASSSQWATQAFNATANHYSSNVQIEPALLLYQGWPGLNRALPDTRPEALNDTNADLVYRGSTRPTYTGASASIERLMPLSAMVSAGGSYNTGRDVYVGAGAVNLNALPLSALAYRDQLYQEEFSRSLRPYPQYKSFNTNGLYPAGRYHRSSAYVSVEKRASAGLSFNFRYSYSRQLDNYSGGRQNYFNAGNEWSLAYHQPHSVTMSYMYELPIGRGQKLFAYSDWRRHLADGWSLSGSTSYYSGEPLAFYTQFNNTGGVVSSLRVNAVAGVYATVEDPGPERWFNPAAFDQPEDFTLGNMPRRHAVLRAPSSQNHDVSLSKRFLLGSGETLEFNTVALNFLNHANWNDPDTVIGPADSPNVNAGRIIGSSGGRVVQVGLRLSF